MLLSSRVIHNWKIDINAKVKIKAKVNISENSTGDENGYKVFEGRVVYVHPVYIVVYNGAYSEAFNKVDFLTGRAEIKECK